MPETVRRPPKDGGDYDDQHPDDAELAEQIGVGPFADRAGNFLHARRPLRGAFDLADEHEGIAQAGQGDDDVRDQRDLLGQRVFCSVLSSGSSNSGGLPCSSAAAFAAGVVGAGELAIRSLPAGGGQKSIAKMINKGVGSFFMVLFQNLRGLLDRPLNAATRRPRSFSQLPMERGKLPV